MVEYPFKAVLEAKGGQTQY